MHPESKAFRDRLFESQIFANFIEHEHRIKYLMDQSNTCKTENEVIDDVTFFEFMKLLSEFPNAKSKNFEKEWDNHWTNRIDSRLKDFQKVTYDLSFLKLKLGSSAHQPQHQELSDVFKQDMISQLPPMDYSKILDVESTRHNMPDSFRQVQAHNRNQFKWHKPQPLQNMNINSNKFTSQMMLKHHQSQNPHLNLSANHQ